MRRQLLLLSLLAMSSGANAGTEFGVSCAIDCQAAFADVVEDVAAALNYKALGPAEPTGITGVGVGAFINYTAVENKDAWSRLTGGEDVDAIGMAGIVATKGLPFGLDVGAFYTAIPGTSVKAYGAELRYAILEGGVASPALALRGAYATTRGIRDFDYAAYSADVSLSKGFAVLTPYVGAGYVWASADPRGANAQAAGLRKTDADHERLFVGMRISLLLLEITPEYERTGDNNGYNLRLGLSF